MQFVPDSLALPSVWRMNREKLDSVRREIDACEEVSAQKTSFEHGEAG